MLGNGDGTFQAPLVHPVQVDPTALLVADFDENGTPDLAISGDSGLQIFRGNGDGTFANETVYMGGIGFDGFLAAADFQR